VAAHRLSHFQFLLPTFRALKPPLFRKIWQQKDWGLNKNHEYILIFQYLLDVSITGAENRDIAISV
jgi:hypothetical protein